MRAEFRHSISSRQVSVVGFGHNLWCTAGLESHSVVSSHQDSMTGVRHTL